MTKRPYREHHMLSLLEGYQEQKLPLDLFISHYFRDHKSLGPKDRGTIAETIYALVRWQGLLDHLCEGPVSWEKRFQLYTTVTLSKYRNDQTIPIHVRCSFPKVLFELVAKSYGEEKGTDLCRISNHAAPTTVRINPAKTSREKMLKLWETRYEVSPCRTSEHGILFHKKINFFSLSEFQEGLFEVQDEGSQLLSTLMQVQPGQQVMDYCSGSGGKTLAFAYKMNGSGQIFLHDIRPHALMEARKRLRRAGVQNAQVVMADDPKLKKIKKKMDWVLVDAPCTGTGTMRRNPDMKWSFTEETLPRLVGQQRTIFEKALSYMKPQGRIVYATCSILNEENGDQLTHFIKTYGLEVEGTPFQCLPSEGGMDGFYGVVLKNRESSSAS
jgi:16S rRNA C967 or C1407 C5-methylase (RsmB/RsmF family)